MIKPTLLDFLEWSSEDVDIMNQEDFLSWFNTQANSNENKEYATPLLVSIVNSFLKSIPEGKLPTLEETRIIQLLDTLSSKYNK